jgi:hypothetical protein
MRARAGWLALPLLFAAGCAASSDAITSDRELVVDDAAELDRVLGDDRVGRVVRANPSAIPDRLSTFESAFGVGRACNRSDSKEIFAVEETSTRITGSQVETPNLLPRLVIGGCNQNPSRPGSIRQTFEMLVAMVSDTERDPNDPIPAQPVEIMALDETTGLYNFYVLEPTAVPNGPATVTRFVRRADNVVERWQKIAGRPATKEVSTNRKCFDCHVHGGPIMNELTEPWTNWVSSHKTLSRPLTGDSRALVSEARPFAGEHSRSSLANQLEQVTRASIAMWVEGIPGVPGSGLGPQILSGAQPGGIPQLLRSVLCETEVNYATVFNTVPVATFVDATVAAFAGLEPAIPPVSGASFTLLPVRSETDQRIEKFLQKARILSADAVLAVRIFDDARDVFSPRRCGLHADVTRRLADAAPEAAIRAALLAALGTGETLQATTPAQRKYLRALLDPATDSAVRDAAEAEYLADITGRYAAEASKLESDAGRDQIARRWRRRQAAARAMFPTAANPLPITPTFTESLP